MTEQPDNLRMVMTFKGDIASVVNECVKRGFKDFKEVLAIQEVMVTVDFSDTNGQIAHAWITSAPNPLIVSYQIKRHGY